MIGASTAGIMILLSKEFANRINIGIGTFIASAVMAFIIALLTVSFLTIKAALANPIDRE